MRVDINDVAVTGIARMMVDVDPNLGGLDRGHCCPKSILNRSVQRNRNIDIFRFGRRSGQQIGFRKKTVFVEHAVFVPDANSFAEFLERKSERKLTAKRISVWPNMTENGEPSMVAQSLADLIELGSAHAFFSSPLSICCKISTMREPRSIDSSRWKTK